jgi:uncharacterized protein YbbC (DUF1343 family)
MLLSKFKNRVFPIIILFVLVLISCGNKTNDTAQKTEDKSLEIEKQFPTTNDIIIGANRTDMYLPLLKGKRVGIVANQTSVIKVLSKVSGLKNSEASGLEIATIRYEHIVDSLLKRNVNIAKVFAPEHGFRGKADA